MISFQINTLLISSIYRRKIPSDKDMRRDYRLGVRVHSALAVPARDTQDKCRGKKLQEAYQVRNPEHGAGSEIVRVPAARAARPSFRLKCVVGFLGGLRSST